MEKHIEALSTGLQLIALGVPYKEPKGRGRGSLASWLPTGPGSKKLSGGWPGRLGLSVAGCGACSEGSRGLAAVLGKDQTLCTFISLSSSTAHSPVGATLQLAQLLLSWLPP